MRDTIEFFNLICAFGFVILFVVMVVKGIGMML